MDEIKTIGESMQPVMKIIIEAEKWFDEYVEFQQKLINKEKNWTGSTAWKIARQNIRIYAATKIKDTELKILALFNID